MAISGTDSDRDDSFHTVELLPNLGPETPWLDRLLWTQHWWDLNFSGRVKKSGQEGWSAERKFYRTSYALCTESKDVGDRRLNEKRFCQAM